MASASMKVTTKKSILKRVMTLKGHGDRIQSISYFPDGQRMISGSLDKTTRKWGLKTGKEIQEARDICEKDVCEEAVSRDGRWVVRDIYTVDISADSTLLASGSIDKIWNLETGKLVAGPFKSTDWVGAIRFSSDSKKLAVKSAWMTCLEVWDKLDIWLGDEDRDNMVSLDKQKQTDYSRIQIQFRFISG